MDKLVQKYSIQEISHKTHLSPIILEKLLNHQFEKIEKVKLKGFITILETEYPEYDFSKLKEEIDIFMQTENISKIEEKNEKSEIKKEDNNSGFKIYIIVVLLIVMIGGIIYYINNKQQKENKHIVEDNITVINNIEKNNSTNIIDETNETNLTIIKDENKTNNIVKLDKNMTLSIIPIEKVWFRITFLDSLKSKEYLTSHEINNSATNKKIFIKFGHGMVKLKCGDNVLEPNTRKVVRVIINNCEMNITTKKLKELE
jgi:hypothetical protein